VSIVPIPILKIFYTNTEVVELIKKEIQKLSKPKHLTYQEVREINSRYHDNMSQIDLAQYGGSHKLNNNLYSATSVSDNNLYSATSPMNMSHTDLAQYGGSPKLDNNDWSPVLMYQYQFDFFALQAAAKYGLRNLNLGNAWPENAKPLNNSGSLNNASIELNIIF
jgi:hypothetical protein